MILEKYNVFDRSRTTQYTNQLAKETNKDMKDLAHLPLPSDPNKQVSTREQILKFYGELSVIELKPLL